VTDRPSAQGVRAREMLGPLHEREFRTLYAGQAVSVVGDGLVPVALAFAVLEIGGSAGDLGIVLGASAASLAVFALVGGVWADRLPRQRVMLAADAVRLVTQGFTAALLLTGNATILALALVQVVYGAGEAFFRPAATGLVPRTVSPERLQQANALLALTYNGGTIVGPALGGILVALTGPGGAFAFDAATFVVSALFLLRLRVAREAALAERGHFLADLADGAREVVRHGWLWRIVVVSSLWLFFALAPFYVLGPLIADEELGGAGAWATILAAYGVGGLLGGVVALRWRPHRPLFAAMLLLALEAPVPALLALGAPVWVIAAAALVGGVSFGIFMTLWDTTMQQRVPDEALSRVSSFDWMGSLALLPLGYALAGPAADRVGVDPVLYVAAATSIVLAVATAFNPQVRSITRLPGPVTQIEGTR
jgi:MFS family permease